MIKYLKVKDGIYKNVELQITIEETVKDAVIDEETGEVIEPPVVSHKIIDNPLIPQDIEELRKVTIDTFNWLIGSEVKKSAGDIVKLSASNSKAIALLVKIISLQSPDLSGLTDLEKAAFDKMLQLAENGYSDSELLNNVLDAVINNITVYTEKIEKALAAETRDELLQLLSE